MIKPLRLRLETVSGDELTGTTPEGQRLTIPMEAVYGTPNVGQELRLVAVVPGAAGADQTALAQALLNELLSPPST